MSRRTDGGGRPRGGAGGAAMALVIIVIVLASAHYIWALIPILAIGAATALLWQPVHAYAARLERGAAPADAALEQRVRTLEGQIDALLKQQLRLQETLHWQERLLDRMAEESHPSRAPISSGSR